MRAAIEKIDVEYFDGVIGSDETDYA